MRTALAGNKGHSLEESAKDLRIPLSMMVGGEGRLDLMTTGKNEDGVD